MISDRQVRFRLSALAFAGATLVGIMIVIPGDSDLRNLVSMLGGGTSGIGMACLALMAYYDRRT